MCLKFPSHLFKPNLLSFKAHSPLPVSLLKAVSKCTFYIISLLFEVVDLIVYFLKLLLNCIFFIHVISATKF